MDRLPVEMLVKVLSYLSIRELVKCRLVSKRFRFLVGLVQPEELRMVKHAFLWRFNLYHTNETIDWNYSLEIRKYYSHYFKQIPFDLSQLRKLQIGLHIDCGIEVTRRYPNTAHHLNWTIFNQFKNLLHLELGNLNFSKKEQLALPRLRVLYIEKIEQQKHTLTLDLPRLEVFFSGACSPVAVLLVHPHTVRVLEKTGLAGDLKIYQNLEILKLNFKFNLSQLSCLATINKEIWRSASNLRELNFRPGWDAGSVYTNEIQELTNNLLREIKFLERKGLRICFHDQILCST